MTRNLFIKKWLGNIDYEYNDENRGLMLDDLDKVIDKALNMRIVGVRLPIGTKVTIIDDKNNFKEDAGKEKTITEYINYLGKPVGYYLDKDDTQIFLIEDFER